MFSKIWVNDFYVVAMYIANSLVTNWSATAVLPPHVLKPSDPYEVLSGLTCLHVYKKISTTRLAMSGSHFTAVVLKCVWKSSSVPPVYGLKIPVCINRDASESDRCMFYTSNYGWSMSAATVSSNTLQMYWRYILSSSLVIPPTECGTVHAGNHISFLTLFHSHDSVLEKETPHWKLMLKPEIKAELKVSGQKCACKSWI